MFKMVFAVMLFVVLAVGSAFGATAEEAIALDKLFDNLLIESTRAVHAANKQSGISAEDEMLLREFEIGNNSDDNSSEGVVLVVIIEN